MRLAGITFLPTLLCTIRGTGGDSATKEGPRGSYYWSSRVSQSLDATLTFENGSVKVQYLFHYPAYRGSHGTYSDLLYFISTPIEYHYNQSSNGVSFNITRGDGADNDFHTLFGHISKWVFDYQPRDPDRHSYIDGDVLKDCIYNKTADSVNLAFFLGYVDFEKENGDPVDLEAKYNALINTGMFRHPIMINRALDTDNASVNGFAKSSYIIKTVTSHLAVIAIICTQFI